MDFEDIQNYKYDNSLHLYRAILYSDCGPGDDRVQVRVMPYMADISGLDVVYLPKYSPFFKGTTIRGYMEKEENIPLKVKRNEPTSVYVLASSDFTVGYVLGPVNEMNAKISAALPSSYNFKSVRKVLNSNNCMPNSFEYSELIIKQNEAGNFIEITSFKSPYKIIMTNTGDTLTIQNNRIYMIARAGTSKDDEASYIDITPKCITIKSEVLDVSQSKKVILGHHGMNAIGTVGKLPGIVGGMNFTPIPGIMV